MNKDDFKKEADKFMKPGGYKHYTKQKIIGSIVSAVLILVIVLILFGITKWFK
jgi:hypothetical protein